MGLSSIKILIEGYAKEIKGGWLASSTTTLIESKGKRIIVDPGINKELLLKKLKKEGLSVNDIGYVFMTHYHPDHAFLAPIFEKALVLDCSTIYDQDRESEYEEMIPGTDVTVIPTPGHAHEHCSLVVPINEEKIVVVGDLFWWRENEKQRTDKKSLLFHKDPFTKDRKVLLKSRQKILKIATEIIPGHGKMFRVK